MVSHHERMTRTEDVATAHAGVGVASLAAAELLAPRNRVPVPTVRVNEAAVATAFVSERHLRIDGRARPGRDAARGSEQPSAAGVRIRTGPRPATALARAAGEPQYERQAMSSSRLATPVLR